MLLKIPLYTQRQFYVQKLYIAPGNLVPDSFNWNIPNDFSCHRPCCLRDSEHRHNIHLQTDALLLWEAMTIVEHYFLPNKYENSTGSSQKKFTLLQDISYECHSFLYPSAVSCLKESANMDKFRAYPSEI